METISAIEAVRRAIDPWGMSGQHTTAMRPTATEVLERLATLGFTVTRIPVEREDISETEKRALWGDR